MGVAKSQAKSKANSRLSWIDLFNIGNVMLMRGQDIQVSHQGMSYFSEFDNFDNYNEDVESPTSQAKKQLEQSGNSYMTSEYGANMPELSIERCKKYCIAKDSFTEIVLLSVIAYFCVSTEMRFIILHNEKEKSSTSNRDSNQNLNSSSMGSHHNSNKSSAGLQSKTTKAQSSLNPKTNLTTETKKISLNAQNSSSAPKVESTQSDI